MTYDVAAVRADIPIFRHRPEGFHYLDNAATGQICRPAADALLAFETERRANVKRSIYPLAGSGERGVRRGAALARRLSRCRGHP